MKKVILISGLYLLAIVFFGSSVALTSDATATSTGNNYWLIQPQVVDANYWVKISGRDVTVNWMTTQFMDGRVIATNKKTGATIVGMGEHLATYHTAAFSLPVGDYTIQPMSVYNIYQKYFGRKTEISIK